MTNNPQFEWTTELLKHQPSPNSRVVGYVNTTCSDNVVLDGKQRTTGATLYQKTTKTDLGGGAYNLFIEGKDIVLKKGNDLYMQVCDQRPHNSSKTPQTTLKNLVIACDVLEIHDDLVIPECNVSIFTRVIDTKEGVCINTSPLKWDRERAEDANMDSAEQDDARNGANGRNAGHIYFFAHTGRGKFLRLISNGGNGQDAGLGKDGKPGNSVWEYYSEFYYTWREKGIFYDSVTHARGNFSPLATLIKYDWYYLVSSGADWKRVGSNDVPTNGGNAKKPGKPGEPGNGGNIHFGINHSAYYRCEAQAGKAGKKAGDTSGGAAGTPTHSAQYELMMEIKVTKKNEDIYPTPTRTKETKTVNGTSYAAPAATKQVGNTGSVVEEKSPNTWLHPAQLKIMLAYVRAEYLRNQTPETVERLKDMLDTYLKALNHELPPLDIWSGRNFQTWTKSQDAITALIAKMEGHKDYFNNPVGYMPLLTLSSSVALYQQNAKDAIKSLVLAKWLSYTQAGAKATKDIITGTYGTITEDSKRMADKMTEVLKKIKDIETRHSDVENELDKLSKKLYPIEERLLKAANDDLQKTAKIKFGLKMGAALLQVIPYAQPALGVVGKMTSSIADNYGQDLATVGKGAMDVLGKEKLGDVLKKTKENLGQAKKEADKQKSTALAVANKKESGSSDDIVAELESKGLMYDGKRFAAFQKKVKITIPGGEKEDEKKKEDEEKASKWSQVSGNMGSAISDVVSGIKALNVPEEEVYASADKLKTQDTEWNEVLADIKKFNQTKAAFFKDFMETLEEYSALSSRIQQNTVMALKLRDSVGKQATLADQDVLDFANELEERTKNQLIYQLYLMTKAYETTTFEALEVNWQTENVFDKIAEQINTKAEFSLQNLNAIVSVVEPVFNANINTIKNLILEFLSKNLPKYRTAYITLHADSPYLQQLNSDKTVTINPHDFSCILPNFQFMKLSDVKLYGFEFENATHTDLLNSVLSLRLNPEGVVRVDDTFRIVRSVPRVHTWSPTATGWKKDEISQTVTDLFKTLMDEKGGQRLASPPAWSIFELGFSPSEAAIQKNITINKVQLEFTYEVVDAGANQTVIDIRTLGAEGAGIRISRLKPEDIYFTGKFYDVTKSRGTIALETDATANEVPFKEWRLVYDTGIVQLADTAIQVDLSKKGLKNIYCVYAQPQLKGPSRLKKPRFAPQPLFSAPDANGEAFSYIKDENLLEFKQGGDVPKGWALVSTDYITGFVKTE